MFWSIVSAKRFLAGPSAAFFAWINLACMGRIGHFSEASLGNDDMTMFMFLTRRVRSLF